MLEVEETRCMREALRVTRIEWQMWGELHTDNTNNHRIAVILEHCAADIQASPLKLKFLPRRFYRVVSLSLRVFPIEGDRPRGNGSSTIRNPFRSLNRSYLWTALFSGCSAC